MEQDTPPLSNTSLAASPLDTAMASAEGLPPSAIRPASTASPLSPTPIRRRPLPTVSPTRHAAPSATSPRIVALPSPSVASASTSVPAHQDNMGPPTSGQGADTESESSSSSPAANVKLSRSRSGSAAKVLENEIVVSTTEANDEFLLIPPAPGLADVTMEDASNTEDAGELVDEGKSPRPLLPKRKRLSAFKEAKEKAVERPTRGVGKPHKTSPAQPQPQPPQKSIVLGYWRDSTVPNRKDRHAVIGFIDTRDRLRTRIQNATRTGEKVPPGHSSPPGPGGSWVTFERIVFEKHLIGLDHNEVKEYVRLLTDPSLASELTDGPNEPTEKDIVSQAIRRAAQNPVPDNPPTPHIAYGVDLPDYVVNAGRPEKKQRVGSSSFQVPLAAAEPARGSTSAAPPPPPLPPPPSHGTIVPFGSPSVASAIQQSAIDLLPGTRPTKILLGFWRGSSEEREEDKHAVFGILGANDMFRVKVTRETRDGRPVFGNFPTGAGALWIHYEEVELEKHLRQLSRPEVKEYVRVRQRQIDEGETPAQAAENESIAVSEAQSRVLSAGGGAQNTFSFSSATHMSCEPNRGGDFTKPFITLQEGPHLRSEYSAGSDSSTTRRSSELREHTTSSLAAAAVAAASAANAAAPYATRSGRHSLLDGIDLATARRYSTGNGPNEANHSPNTNRVEQTNSLARREVARIETIQIRNDQRAASRDIHGSVSGGYGPGSTTTGGSLALTNMGTNSQGIYGAANASAGSSSRQLFNENIGRLNKVWAAQEASRLRAGGEDAKIYMGVKYERKQTGPFQGKLVSPGIILSIDGEDYVEYRVLTKPTFF